MTVYVYGYAVMWEEKETLKQPIAAKQGTARYSEAEMFQSHVPAACT
jgi:hypothetical protein